MGHPILVESLVSEPDSACETFGSIRRSHDFISSPLLDRSRKRLLSVTLSDTAAKKT